MTTLDEVSFNGPVPLHGRLVREIKRGAPIPRNDGTLGPAWELHLHAEWGCVVVEDGGSVALVPLQHVRSMILAPGVQETPVPGWFPASEQGADMLGSPRRGRARTKRLGVVRE